MLLAGLICVYCVSFVDFCLFPGVLLFVLVVGLLIAWLYLVFVGLEFVDFVVVFWFVVLMLSFGFCT